MKEKDCKYTCINEGDRKCIKYEQQMYKWEIIKAIVTPRMVLTMGFVITLIMSAMKG